MKSKKEEIEAITWQRETAPFEKILMKYSARRLLTLGTGLSALDVGCNDGLFSKELCRYFRRVVGIDASSRHIERAHQRVPEAEFHVAFDLVQID